MDATVQGIFLAAYFVAPGFLHYYVTRAFGLGSDADPSDAQLLIRSLSFTLILVAAEAGAVVLAAIFWEPLKEQLQNLVSLGFSDYAAQRPFLLIGCGTAVLGTNLTVAAVAGFHRVPDAWIEKRLRRIGFTESSVWPSIIGGHGQREWDNTGGPVRPSGRTLRAARVRLKSGAIYTGFVGSYTVRAGKDGTRDIALWDVLYAPPPLPDQPHPEPPPFAPLPPSNGGNAVIINSSEIGSVEVYYVYPERAN